MYVPKTQTRSSFQGPKLERWLGVQTRTRVSIKADYLSYLFHRSAGVKSLDAEEHKSGEARKEVDVVGHLVLWFPSQMTLMLFEQGMRSFVEMEKSEGSSVSELCLSYIRSELT
jgi:hypothetical protein